MSIIQLTGDNFEQEVLAAEGTVLVDFSASWCGPCQILAPIIDDYAMSHDDIKVCKIDIDEELDIAMEYEVMSVPTLVVFRNGEEVNRGVGVHTDSMLDALVQ